MNFIESKRTKFVLIIIILLQLFYISHNRLKFRSEIIINSLKDGFGSKYIMTEDLMELKLISNNLKLDKFNISENLKKIHFFIKDLLNFYILLNLIKILKKYFIQ